MASIVDSSSEEFSSTNPNYEILFFTVHVLGDEHLPHPPDLRRDVRAEAHRVTRVCTGRRSVSERCFSDILLWRL